MTTSDGKVQVQSQLNQACETPLPELLRIIPKDITIGLQIDHITFGAPYHHIPVGYNCHRAADMIECLTALLSELRTTLAERDAAIAAKERELLRFIGYLSGAIPELHNVEVPRLAAAWIAYQAALALGSEGKP